MPDRSWFIVSFPTPIIFRYHLPLKGVGQTISDLVFKNQCPFQIFYENLRRYALTLAIKLFTGVNDMAINYHYRLPGIGFIIRLSLLKVEKLVTAIGCACINRGHREGENVDIMGSRVIGSSRGDEPELKNRDLIDKKNTRAQGN